LHIKESFRGATVTVSAEVPKGAGAVVELKGPVEEDHLLRKGRRGGLWMSVGEVTVHEAPSTYLLLTTPDLPPDEEGGPQWGYKALERRIRFEGSLPKQGSEALFDQFVKLKESEGLYGVLPSSLRLVGTSGDSSTVEGQFRLPGNIAPGSYRLVLSVINSGKLVEQQSAELAIDMQGLPGILFALALRHALLYGVIAVLVALATGFLMGFLFKGKGAH